MNKKLIVAGLSGVICCLFGFVAVESYISANTVSDFASLYDWARSKGHTPPIPDIDPVAVYEQLKAGDFSFMDEKWFRIESLGAVYVSSKTKELKHLDLPLTVRIYRYPSTDSVYVLSSKDGTNFVSETALVLEPLVDETFETMTTDEQRSWLLFALWETRAVYEVMLKSEDDALADLLNVEQTLLSAQSAQTGVSAPLMMTMSVPEEHTNDLWLALEIDGGTNTLNVFAPDTMTNIEVFAGTDLCSGLWSRIATNINPTGPTNPATLSAGSSNLRFFRACTFDDVDEDGLSTGQEMYVYKTDPDDFDSDDDDLSDGAEIETHETDPLNSDTEGDGMPDGWEVIYGLNALTNDAAGDPYNDNFSNLHEYLIDTDPQSDISEAEDLIFDETTENIEFREPAETFLVENENLSAFGSNCLAFVMRDDDHYSPTINADPGDDYSFVDADEFRFYIRTASGIQSDPFKLKLIYSFDSNVDMSSLDIQPYIYDLNGNPSTNITEQYKMVKVPFTDMKTETNQFSGVFRRIQFSISEEQAQTVDNLTFYVDRISLQDTTGLTVENIESFDASHLEVTCDDQLDFISARTISNHVLSVSNSPVEITGIGLRSWVEGFRNSQAGSPIVKHYITLELEEPLVEGQMVTYSNHVQDVSGNYPASGMISFTYSETNVSSSIKVNQVGWLPEATKIAYVGNYLGDLGAMHLDTNLSHTAYVQDVDTGLNVYTSQLVQTENPDYFPDSDLPVSGEEVWRIDFSSVQTPGEYRIAVPGIGCSYDFEIGTNIYADTYTHCMRSLWYQRSGISMTNSAWCGQWTRIGDVQQNTNTAFYHNSIYDKSFELYDNEEIGGYADFTGGWYDAADYDKYTKSAADAVNMLLTMYEICPERFADNQLDIPESGNGIPDVLDEAKWELDWICKMVSSNGAAFNKVTYESWPNGMPCEQNRKLWVTLKTTLDTAASCAILAKAARIYEPYDSVAATLYSNKAILAWQCLTNFPDSYPVPPAGMEEDYNNPPGTSWVANGITNTIPGINTGPYFSTNDFGHRVWAHIEMYRLTENQEIHRALSNTLYQAMVDYNIELDTVIARMMYGSLVSGEGDGYSSGTRPYVMFYDYACLTNGPPVFEDIRSLMADRLVGLVDTWIEHDLPYDFELKSYSNTGLGEGSMVRRPYGYILAYELTGDTNWLERARINLDWPLGANPLSTTYITGIGDNYPMHPHNKFDHGDGVDEPIPGYNIYGLAHDLEDRDIYSAILAQSYPVYRTSWASPGDPIYPLARKYVDTWESVAHGEFVIDDLARTAMVFAYFSSTNAP